jgi:DNA polymerase-4
VLRSLFIDFNSYFASVEQQLNPDLRGKPIGVVPMMVDTTAILAASYEAKAFGVKTGTRVYDAKQMCPGLVLVQARHTDYIRYHHQLVECVGNVIPVKRVMSIDEMVCDLMRRQRTRETAVEIAHTIKREIIANVGTELRCSIGIAPNDYLAKTATDMQKPDGLVVIEEADLPNILYSLELRDLVGIGRKMYDHLFRAGIYTVEMLCTASREKLREVWGGIEGDRMWARLRGEVTPYVETHKSSISHEHVLEPALRSREGAIGVLHRLLQKAATRLRSYGLLTGQLTVSIRHRDQSRWKEVVHITPTQDSMQLTKLLSDKLKSWKPETRNQKSETAPIKVRVELAKLAIADATPIPLFENFGPARDKLNASLDKLNAKYGKNTVYVGTAWNALNSAPMRIAFNHIPDIETDEDT